MEIEQTVPKTAMVIFAHPDDAEFSCSGTVAAWIRKGCRVTYVLLTSGNVGSHEPGMTREWLASIREAEQKGACDILKVRSLVFLRHDDCQLEPSVAVRRELVGLIRHHKPEVVICGDPTSWYWGDGYINHPDHRAAATVALDAIAPAASMPLLWTEAGPPHRVRAIYISGGGESGANVAVDITETIDLKIEALRAHKSQIGDWEGLDERIREWASESAKDLGVQYAERFRRMIINPPAETPEAIQSEVTAETVAAEAKPAEGA